MRNKRLYPITAALSIQDWSSSES